MNSLPTSLLLEQIPKPLVLSLDRLFKVISIPHGTTRLNKCGYKKYVRTGMIGYKANFKI